MRGSAAIVGRERELEAIAALLDPGVTGAAALVLEGEPGIGKTTVWERAVEKAREEGYCVLRCQPTESEASLPFVALGDLLEPVLDDVLPVLVPPQRLALETALARVQPTEPPERLVFSRAVLSSVRELSKRAPLLVAIDDVQWLDPATANALEFTAHRAAELPVRVLITRRSDGDGPPPLGMERGLGPARVQSLRAGPLLRDELGSLLRSRLGLQLSRGRLVELHRMSGGNPFYALEIAAAAERRGSLVDGAPLDVPGSLGDLLGERLSGLSPEALDAIVLVASSSQAVTPLVERAAGGGDGLAEAVRQAMLEADGVRLRFTHPLIGSVAYGLATPEERRRAHLRLAEATSDPEERARQLGLGAEAPDEGVAAQLEDAATAAASRGGPEAAAELFELAATLTPADQSGSRDRRRFEAARHSVLVGDVESVRSVLEDLVDNTPSGSIRAKALVLLADVEDDQERGRELCVRAVQEAGADPRLAADAHRMLAEFLMILGDLRLALEHARIGARLAEECGDEALLIQSLGIVGHFETYTGEITPGLLERGVTLEESAASTSAHYSPAQIYALRLMYADRLDEARERLEPALARAREAGDEFECRNILNHLTQLEIRAGNWARAERHARELEELVQRLGFHRSIGSFARALVEAHLGRVDEALSVAADGLKEPEVHESSFISIMLRWAQGFAELSRGNTAGAAELLGPAASALLEIGYRNPGVRPILPDAVEALLGDGRVDDARPLLTALEEGGRALDNPWALATAGRCRGMLLAGEGDLTGALETYEQALLVHERAASPFERARTQLAFGTALRRAKRRADARAMLTEALEAFDTLGALLWAENAAAELARIPGRTPSSGELSETQRRVAELVAGGLSNKEVAAKLFITVRTVEANLSNVYAKLGIRSRTELASRLASSDRPQ